MNNLHFIFIESSATVYGRDIINNYFVSIGDPTVRLTTLLIGSVLFVGLKMTQ